MTQQDDSGQLREHFAQGLEAINGAVDLLDRDPAVGLAQLTWFGLRMAQEAQRLTSGVEIVDEMAEHRYHSMEGLLCGPSGSIMTISPETFSALAEAFERGI